MGLSLRKYLAEVIGTFTLVFCCTGAIVSNEVSGGAVTHVGICMATALTVLAMIYALGDISGAHMNPAVTVGFVLAKRMGIQEGIPYILAQVIGGLLGSIAIKLLFPMQIHLGGTYPTGSDLQSFILEIILTFFLMFVVLNVSRGEKEKGITAGIAISAVVGLEALFAGPICGASMNPIRSLAPALVAMDLHAQWIYLTAPFLGSIVAVIFHKVLHPVAMSAANPTPPKP